MMLLGFLLSCLMLSDARTSRKWSWRGIEKPRARTPKGYCADWRYASTGTRTGGYDNKSNTPEACAARCLAILPKSTSFYLKNGKQCGCSATLWTSGLCKIKPHNSYTTYDMRGQWTQALTLGHTNWGTWRGDSFCQGQHSFVTGFSLRIEDKQGGGGKDDTALNGVEMYCKRNLKKKISSSHGYFGKWHYVGVSGCPPGSGAATIKYRSERPCGKCDDTAANGMQLGCRWIRSGRWAGWTKGISGHWGDWEQSSCPHGYFIKGFNLQVERPKYASGDDTAANKIKVFCTKAKPRVADAKSCKGWQCSINGQFCPAGVPGSAKGGYCCRTFGRIRKWVAGACLA